MKKTNCLMPDYYPDFSCKMGACRTSCCEGWAVSISQAEYYKLLGLKCSKKLRHEIDCSLRILTDATPERFATLEHRWDGNCHMRLEDGRCAIHAALGEKNLPQVCRNYPRSIIETEKPECSCANSCERTLEILIHHKGSLKFIIPEGYQLSEEQEMRQFFIEILQDRDISIPGRFYRLGLAMQAFDRSKKEGNGFNKETVLKQLQEAKISVTANEILNNLSTGLSIISDIIKEYDTRSKNLHDYGEEVLAKANKDQNIKGNYLEAKTIFETLFPNWESSFENMLVNHMFFSGFPFDDNGKSLEEEFGTLCALYGMMRVLCLGWVIDHPDENELVDLLSKVFRFVDHTRFHHSTANILKAYNITDLNQFFTLANI